jgi:hypothetical protein
MCGDCRLHGVSSRECEEDHPDPQRVDGLRHQLSLAGSVRTVVGQGRVEQVDWRNRTKQNDSMKNKLLNLSVAFIFDKNVNFYTNKKL